MSKPIPPFFLLQGQNDSVLPYQQSVRLCNALAGRAIDTASPSPDATSELRNILDCGHAESQLHLITEGEHALDLCVADELCLAGSPASAALTRDSVEQMLDWIKKVGVVQDDDGNGGSGANGSTASMSGVNGDAVSESFSGSGGGAISPYMLKWLCVLAVLAGLRQRRHSLTT